MGTALHSLPCGARRLLQVVVPLRSLRGCGRYGVDPGIHYPPATDLAGGRSPNVEGDHWSSVARKTVVSQTHRRTTPHSLDLFCEIHEAIARHTKIRDQNPSLGLMSLAPTLQNVRIGLKKREWQEQGAREAAWKLDKNVFKLKEHERAAFFSSPENRCLPASTLKLEEREFVVDSGASMHMISKKDLSDAEMNTLTKSCSPTIVTTANGEVQTH